jgi:predicted DNA-binding ribbon-helix-helix protein
MDAYLTRRSLKIGDDDFTFSIEAHFWICFEEIARAQATTAEKLAQSIVASRADEPLASAIRTYVLTYFRNKARTAIEVEPVPLPESLAPAGTDSDIDDSRPRWLN